MPKLPRLTLKSFFEKGDKPTQGQFAAFLDSVPMFIDDKDILGLRLYSTARFYSAGDTVVHLDSVYICLGDTSGSFDPLKWKNLAAFGAVIYLGAWDALANTPTLATGTGTKGTYYVVSVSGSTNLDGITDWSAGDWAIFNGVAWEKVDNTEDQVAADIEFTPNGDITSTNVQDAIVEVRDNTDNKLDDKADKVSGAVNDNFASLDANGNLKDSLKSPADYLAKDNAVVYSPSTDYNPATKLYVDDADADKADKVVGAVNDNFAALDANGNLKDSLKSPADYLAKDNAVVYSPSTDYNPATKLYVDDADADKADKVSGATSGDIATLTASGNLADSGFTLTDFLSKINTIPYTPTGDYNPATKKYVDDTTTALGVPDKADKVTGAVNDNFAALDAAGNLKDSLKSPADYLAKDNAVVYSPSTDYNPATKKYVDDTTTALGVPNKADKVTGAVNDNFAALDAAGNLKDSLKSPADYLAKDNAVVYSPSTDYNPATKLYVDDGLDLKQDLDPTLTALAGLATGADQLPYATGTDTFSQTTLSAYARTLIDDADAATARGTLGLGDVATRNVGTTAGTAAAGDDARFTDARRRKMVASTTTAFTGSAAAGTDELAYTLSVTAGEISAGCFINLPVLCRTSSNPGAGHDKIFKLWVNTSPSLSGATQAGTCTVSSNSQSFLFMREFAVRSLTSVIGGGSATVSMQNNTISSITTAPTAITVPDLSGAHYWMISVQRENVSDTAGLDYAKLNIDKV